MAMLRALVAAPVVVFLVVVIVGGITGRVRLQSCCAVGDPERDKRMRPDHVPAEDLETQLRA